MGAGMIFTTVPRGEASGFFQGGNNGEISFYPLRNYEKNIFLLRANSTMSNFKIQGVLGPSLPAHPSDARACESTISTRPLFGEAHVFKAIPV